MRPKKLCLCAWGPYPNKEEVDFSAFDDRGIFLITGATGAGKTTIFDAISYALYGALSGDERDKERNSVRSDFAEAHVPTYVELVMEHRGEIYQIRRNPEYFRPKKRGAGGEAGTVLLTKEKENAVLICPDGKTLEGVREVNAALQDILGLDYQQFKKISMIAQGEFARLLVAPPREKTKIFREIFGTGIYERFTQGLSARSKKLYAKVMEHKAKLSEDVRLLGVDIDRRGWSADRIAGFKEITGAIHWNYEDLSGCLTEMEAEASLAVKEQKKRYEKADKEVSIKTALLTEQEQINRNLEQFAKASRERERLAEQAEEYVRREELLNKARKAAYVESVEKSYKQAESLLDSRMQEQVRLQQEQKALQQEATELVIHVEWAERIREMLRQKMMLEEMQREQQTLIRKLESGNKELSQKQEHYLVKEKDYILAKQSCENAERQRRFAAIGLAAELLENGKPCPVCGSTEHPLPAKVEGDVISEQALQVLQEKKEHLEKEQRSLYEAVVMLKTTVEHMKEQKESIDRRLEEGCRILQNEQEPICQEYLEMNADAALKLLQDRCLRAGEIEGLLQEKAGREKQLESQISEGKKSVDKFSRELDTMLKDSGFADMAEYEAAKCTPAECDELQRSIKSYSDSVAANKELYTHLEEVCKGKSFVDPEEQKLVLEEAKTARAVILKEQKKWEQNLNEVKKTIKLVTEKLAMVEEDSKEYGYVKDLENMAVGNNPRKLVFEQFVLAGYFEEILRAANIRFRKMTSGRYEMERVGEVGDGRVKDNLEIQVMDYYTGKYRSVRTLSGGESFKASLALALGMSDVIQSMNGGIRVDTLFVDEGFGALDEESLNQACDTLMALVEKNRLIGIISHVPELRERIDRQLVIHKSGSGSTIGSVL